MYDILIVLIDNQLYLLILGFVDLKCETIRFCECNNNASN